MSSEQEEKRTFRNILLRKPAWRGLAGSELEDIITSYVGQRAAATLFQMERGRQENFLQLACDRESIMARAEAEGYVPALPSPMRLEVAIVNEGSNPVPLNSLLNSSRPLEMMADDETRLVLEDELISMKSPSEEDREDGQEEEPGAESGNQETGQEEEEADPENTVTRISAEMDETIGGYAIVLNKLGDNESPPSKGYNLTEYSLQLQQVGDEADISASQDSIVIARKEDDGSLFFRVFDADSNILLSCGESDLLAKKEAIEDLKGDLSEGWPASSETTLEITNGEQKSAILHKTLDIASLKYLLILAKDSSNKLHFCVFDREGGQILSKSEDSLPKQDDINYLKAETGFDSWSDKSNIIDPDEKATIINALTQITETYKNILTETKTTITTDSYPAGKEIKTRTVTTTVVFTEMLSGDQSYEVSEVVTKTINEPHIDSDGDSFILETVTITDPQTVEKTVTKKVDGQDTQVSHSFATTDAETGTMTETSTAYAEDGSTVASVTVIVAWTTEDAEIREITKTDSEEKITSFARIETCLNTGKATEFFAKFDDGNFFKTISTSHGDGTKRRAEIRPSDSFDLETNEITERDGLIYDGDSETPETPIDGSVTVTLTAPDLRETITATTLDNGEITVAEYDPGAGYTKITVTDAEGNRTETVEFDDLHPGCSAIVAARQLWKETRYFNTSPKKDETFQEFIVGGTDENGDFTVHDFEVEINDEKWTREQNFLNGGPDSSAYHVYYRLSDELAFRLGDGEVGRVPPPQSGVKVTVWHTSGDRVFMAPGAEITPLADSDEPAVLNDDQGNEAMLRFTSGRVLESGQPLENVESIRKNALSHIQIGGVAARSVDYEYKIRRRFPELLYLKVWGEKEQIAHYGYDTAHINKAFFTFLIERKDEESAEDHKYRTDTVADAIENYFNSMIRPMNVTPQYEKLNLYGFEITIRGAVDRVYSDIAAVEKEIRNLLLVIFGVNRSEKEFLIKFGDSDKRDSFMELFRRYFRINGRPQESDVYEVLRQSEFFRDAQPHLNRRKRPYFEMEEPSWTNEPPTVDFFDQYIYLDRVGFTGGEGNANLGYVENF